MKIISIDWTDKAFKGTVVNRTLLSLYEGSFIIEITLTVTIPYIQNQGKDNTDRRTNKRFKRSRRGGVQLSREPWEKSANRGSSSTPGAFKPWDWDKTVRPVHRFSRYLRFVFPEGPLKIWNRRTILSYVYFISL